MDPPNDEPTLVMPLAPDAPKPSKRVVPTGVYYKENYHIYSLVLDIAKPVLAALFALMMVAYMGFGNRQYALILGGILLAIGYAASLVSSPSAWGFLHRVPSRHWHWLPHLFDRIKRIGWGGAAVVAVDFLVYVSRWGILAIFLLGLLFVCYPVVRAVVIWQNTWVVLTRHEIMKLIKAPWWVFAEKRRLRVPLHDISSVEPKIRWWMPDSWKLGHLVVDTPGQQDEELNKLRYIRRPDELSDLIMEAIQAGHLPKPKSYKMKEDPDDRGSWLIDEIQH